MSYAPCSHGQLSLNPEAGRSSLTIDSAGVEAGSRPAATSALRMSASTPLAACESSSSTTCPDEHQAGDELMAAAGQRLSMPHNKTRQYFSAPCTPRMSPDGQACTPDLITGIVPVLVAGNAAGNLSAAPPRPQVVPRPACLQQRLPPWRPQPLPSRPPPVLPCRPEFWRRRSTRRMRDRRGCRPARF